MVDEVPEGVKIEGGVKIVAFLRADSFSDSKAFFLAIRLWNSSSKPALTSLGITYSLKDYSLIEEEMAKAEPEENTSTEEESEESPEKVSGGM